MLCLARNPGESVQCDGPVRVTVIEIRGGRVKLGFTAPYTTNIVRTELLDVHHPGTDHKSPVDRREED